MKLRLIVHHEMDLGTRHGVPMAEPRLWPAHCELPEGWEEVEVVSGEASPAEGEAESLLRERADDPAVRMIAQVGCLLPWPADRSIPGGHLEVEIVRWP